MILGQSDEASVFAHAQDSTADHEPLDACPIDDLVQPPNEAVLGIESLDRHRATTGLRYGRSFGEQLHHSVRAGAEHCRLAESPKLQRQVGGVLDLDETDVRHRYICSREMECDIFGGHARTGYRRGTMLSLLLACTTAAALTSAVEAQPVPNNPVHVRTIAWSIFGVDQSVRVTSNDARPWELSLENAPDVWLRSIVGPFFSTVEFHDPDANGEHHTAQVVTRIDSAIAFDLVNWIDHSRQSGPVLAQLLSNPRCTMEATCETPAPAWPEQPQCPSAAAIESWDGGMMELSRMLVSTGCFTDAQVGIQAGAFWIDGWDGESVTLAIQREHCLDADANACRGEVSFVAMKPPKSWHPWLTDAKDRHGHLPRLAPAPSEPAPEPPAAPATERPLPSLAQR